MYLNYICKDPASKYGPILWFQVGVSLGDYSSPQDLPEEGQDRGGPEGASTCRSRACSGSRAATSWIPSSLELQGYELRAERAQHIDDTFT